jgi:glycosyltransferase involved in cell wall biosynthesis
MRILFLNTTGGFFGGVEQNIYFAAEGLTARGHHCFFASENRAGEAFAQFDDPFEGVWDLSEVPLDSVVKKTAPDVVYVHKFGSIREVYDAAPGLPVVRMYHDHDIYCPRRHKYYFWNHHICTRKAGLACYADLAFLERSPQGIRFSSIRKKLKELRENRNISTAIVGSGYIKNELIRNGFAEERIRVIPPCVAPPESEPAPLPSVPSLLYVGQIIRGKGVDILLRAHQLLQKSFPEGLPLEIIGTGNAESYVQKLAEELNIQDRVTFHGWIPNDRITPFYDAASLLVVPSRWPEPFGMIGVEAMLRGRPVVASRAGGIPDWLEDGVTGYLVPPNAPHKLAEKIEILLRNPEQSREFGRAGYKRALEQFGYDTYIRNLESILMGAGRSTDQDQDRDRDRDRESAEREDAT